MGGGGRRQVGEEKECYENGIKKMETADIAQKLKTNTRNEAKEIETSRAMQTL